MLANSEKNILNHKNTLVKDITPSSPRIYRVDNNHHRTTKKWNPISFLGVHLLDPGPNTRFQENISNKNKLKTKKNAVKHHLTNILYITIYIYRRLELVNITFCIKLLTNTNKFYHCEALWIEHQVYHLGGLSDKKHDALVLCGVERQGEHPVGELDCTPNSNNVWLVHTCQDTSLVCGWGQHQYNQTCSNTNTHTQTNSSFGPPKNNNIANKRSSKCPP